jgi:ATP-dependent helicase HrpA
VQLLDEAGSIIAQDRDLESLRARHADNVEARVSQRGHSLEEPELSDFPEQLPASVTLGEGESTVVVYPTLVDEGDTVALRLLPSQAQQQQSSRNGYARLALQKLSQTTRFLKKQQALERDLGLLYAPLGNAELLRDELLLAAAWQCFFEGRELPRDAAAFSRRLDRCRSELAPRFDLLQQQLRDILESRQQLSGALDAASSPAFSAAVADVRAQLQRLVGPRVLSETPASLLAEIPRFLQAAIYRLDHLQGRVEKDARKQQLINALEDRVDRLRDDSGGDMEGWQHFRFLLEEVRVGVFAESLGVRGKSSIKRFDRALAVLERELGLI